MQEEESGAGVLVSSGAAVTIGGINLPRLPRHILSIRPEGSIRNRSHCYRPPHDCRPLSPRGSTQKSLSSPISHWTRSSDGKHSQPEPSRPSRRLNRGHRGHSWQASTPPRTLPLRRFAPPSPDAPVRRASTDQGLSLPEGPANPTPRIRGVAATAPLDVRRHPKSAGLPVPFSPPN
jgi:hypothetical protein